MRFRLRFLLQEFDLTKAETFIGRSNNCDITINDSLASRRHAKITLGTQCQLEDLQSTNGVKLNGVPLEGRSNLKNGDRIRIGKLELVFISLGERTRKERATGQMLTCHACGTPFIQGAGHCPRCGAEEDVTIPRVASIAWRYELMGEVIDRALAGGQHDHAKDILARAKMEITRRPDTPLSAEEVHAIAFPATKLTFAISDTYWLDWSLRLHEIHGVTPSEAFVDLLAKTPLDNQPIARRALETYLEDEAQVRDWHALVDKLRMTTIE